MTNATPSTIALWSAPRSMSTAFFRMMIERGDFQTVHEPFSYLAEFGSVEIEGVVLRSEPELLNHLRTMGETSPLFFKDTTDERYPTVLDDKRFLAEDAVHTFLIRPPRETIASYYRLNPDLKRDQIGFSHQLELFEAVREATGRTPWIVDAARLLEDPGTVVRDFCDVAGIEFKPEALTWEPGHRAEWGPSQRWHEEVSRTSGFVAPRGGRPSGPDIIDEVPRLADILEYQQPFYDRLLAHAV